MATAFVRRLGSLNHLRKCVQQAFAKTGSTSEPVSLGSAEFSSPLPASSVRPPWPGVPASTVLAAGLPARFGDLLRLRKLRRP